METKFTILSHACILLERNNTKIIMDPWLISSCYWGSWWNYPEPTFDPMVLEQVDYVIISHVHWDHWHGLTLKKYFKGATYIIPDEYQQRSFKDLKQLKLGEIIVAKHGRTIKLPNDIEVTCYSFGLFLNDAAIAVKTPECNLLNINDCKIAGLPLKHILKKHGHFDFALRSHSSANYRACIKLEEDVDGKVDDLLHYSRDFSITMNQIRPTYAVPFASNHCHLHKDTFHFNKIVTNPLRLKDNLELFPLKNSQLKLMIPGSSWSSRVGFNMASLSPFENVLDNIEIYRKSKRASLDSIYDKERKTKITKNMIEKHQSHIKSWPTYLRKKLDKNTVSYCVEDIDGNKIYYKVCFTQALLSECGSDDYRVSSIRFKWPIKVFYDAVYRNMYHHAFISKRVFFYINKRRLLKPLKLTILSLELTELNLFPLRFSYFYTMLKSYYSRYLEIIVYFQAAYYVAFKKIPRHLLNEYIGRIN